MTTATTFRRMHDDRNGFLMPNAWDAGSAVLLADAGFDAIATTSAGIAHSLGMADFLVPKGAKPVSQSEMFDRVRQIVEAVEIPVNGDLEAGYGEKPEAVAETIRLAIDAGLAGANIEDHAGGEFYDEELAVERLVAAREVIDASGTDFVLTGRSDWLFFQHRAPLADGIRRLNRFREAGAHCLYLLTANKPETITTVVRETDAPLNVIMSGADTVAGLRSLGVARISLGSGISRAAAGFVRAAARELIEEGTQTFASAQTSLPDLNEIFARHERGTAKLTLS